MPGTAQEHFDHCVERAMSYMDAGKPQEAVASFITDIGLHEGTASIASNSATTVLLLGAISDPIKFREVLEILKV